MLKYSSCNKLIPSFLDDLQQHDSLQPGVNVIELFSFVADDEA